MCLNEPAESYEQRKDTPSGVPAVKLVSVSHLILPDIKTATTHMPSPRRVTPSPFTLEMR